MQEVKRGEKYSGRSDSHKTKIKDQTRQNELK